MAVARREQQRVVRPLLAWRPLGRGLREHGEVGLLCVQHTHHAGVAKVRGRHKRRRRLHDVGRGRVEALDALPAAGLATTGLRQVVRRHLAGAAAIGVPSEGASRGFDD